MEEKQEIIVVPWDFTPVADNALAHAVKISRMVRNDICLLHIVDKAIIASEEGEKKVRNTIYLYQLRLKREVYSLL